ncbi:MAG: DM13 domain-containing protein [Oscillatoriophycideae cyanobacterium NC_groundwater_1537_Pr4_S-0.65um_50_18]|nr:DM13 domain-containing protein [Oscillatoriophycideae cyanobacterium NC_groundwater_1537_Pr4_S-0.65um_50_18]
MRVNLHFGLILGLSALVIVGCTSAVAVDPSSSPIAQVSPVASSPAAPNSDVSPIASAAESSQVLKTGTFASGEHPTQGIVRLVSQGDRVFLELDQTFTTSSNGPDLVVILHRSSDVLGSTQPPAFPIAAGEYVVLAPLEKFSGAQRYAIPSDVDVADYASAAIWCRQFNATFGAALLQ